MLLRRAAMLSRAAASSSSSGSSSSRVCAHAHQHPPQQQFGVLCHAWSALPLTQPQQQPCTTGVSQPPPLPQQQRHRGAQGLRCYSGAPQQQQETAAAGGGPRKLKYNLRQLTKDDVDISFARSGGAGGQNVNKVNTKVDMRWELDKAGWIPDDVKEAIQRAEKNRFTKEGVLVLTSTRHRTQSQNLDDCLSKLQAMVDAAVEAVTPKEIDPETVKRVKAAIKAGNERRLDTKKKDAKKKTERRRRDFD